MTREITTTRTAREIIRLDRHQSLDTVSEWEGVGRAERYDVGVRQVQVVLEPWLPARRRQSHSACLGKLEVGIGLGMHPATVRSAAVKLPVEQTERDDIGGQNDAGTHQKLGHSGRGLAFWRGSKDHDDQSGRGCAVR
jgi:hypothetical protein